MSDYFSDPPPSYHNRTQLRAHLGQNHAPYPILNWASQIPPHSNSNNNNNNNAFSETEPLLPNNKTLTKPQKHRFLTIFALSVVASFLAGLFITLPADDPVVWERDRMQHRLDMDLWESQRKDWKQDQLIREEEQRAWRKERWIRERERTMYDKDRVTWEGEREHMKTERAVYQSELAMWNNERLWWVQEQAEWAHKRALWEREQSRWESERKKHDEACPVPPGANWQALTSASHCESYGKREYTARLMDIPSGWDWTVACKATPIQIHGRTVRWPDFCENKGVLGGMVGHWILDFEETACRPMFEDFHDLGCVSGGTNLKRVEAKIRNIQPGDDWMKMCGTTPATIGGLYYLGPSHCEDRGSDLKVGLWDIHDSSCQG